MNATFFGLAFLGALNPKLFGVDLLLFGNRRPRKMFLCFIVGALGLSVTLGVLDVLVFQLDAVQTQGSISAGLDVALGALLLAVGALVATGRLHGRRHSPVPIGGATPQPKREGWAQRTLRQPRFGLAVLIGALFGTPGVTYLTALRHLTSGHYSTATQLSGVLVFNLIQFSPVIVPFALLEARPEGTKAAVERVSGWLSRNARHLIAGVALAVGAYMFISGILRLLGS